MNVLMRCHSNGMGVVLSNDSQKSLQPLIFFFSKGKLSDCYLSLTLYEVVEVENSSEGTVDFFPAVYGFGASLIPPGSWGKESSCFLR